MAADILGVHNFFFDRSKKLSAQAWRSTTLAVGTLRGTTAVAEGFGAALVRGRERQMVGVGSGFPEDRGVGSVFYPGWG